MKKSGELSSCSSQTPTSDGRTMDKLLKHTRALFLEFLLGTESPLLRYCNTEVLKPIPYNPELRKIWKRRSGEVEGMEVRKEEETLFTRSTTLLECKFNTHHNSSIGSADQSLREIVHYKACRQEYCALLSTSESVLQVSKII